MINRDYRPTSSEIERRAFYDGVFCTLGAVFLASVLAWLIAGFLT